MVHTYYVCFPRRASASLPMKMGAALGQSVKAKRVNVQLAARVMRKRGGRAARRQASLSKERQLRVDL